MLPVLSDRHRTSNKDGSKVVFSILSECIIQITEVIFALTRDNLVVITQSEEGTIYLAEAPGSGMSFGSLANSCENLHSELNKMKYTMK